MAGIRMKGQKELESVPDNVAYKAAAASLLFEVAREKEIDPRL
jgi:hypothetical protein